MNGPVGVALIGVMGALVIGGAYWLKQMQDITQELILRKFRSRGLRRVA